MATTVGIIFNEYDNTQYTIPTSTSTFPAMIGFATKGPIGVPMMLNSYKDFVDTFGKATSVKFSSIAAQDILTRTDNLLFIRVADSTASPSTTLIKNGKSSQSGRSIFNRKKDLLIGSQNYISQGVYRFKVEDCDNNYDPKDFYIRAPKDAKLSLNNILSQIEEQKAKTPGTYEIKLSQIQYTKMYSFNVKIGSSQQSPFNNPDASIFVGFLSGDKGESIYETIYRNIGKTNTICVLSVKRQQTPGNFVPYTETDVLNSGSYKLRLNINGIIRELNFVVDINDTIDIVVSKLNNLLAVYGVLCFSKFKKNSGGNVTDSEIAFVTKSKEASAYINIQGNIVQDSQGNLFASSTDLFVATPTYNTDNQIGKWDEVNYGSRNNFYVSQKTIIDSQTINYENLNYTVSYKQNTNSIVFETIDKGLGETIELSPASWGNYLLEENNGITPIGWIVGKINGQDEFGLATGKDALNRIYFESSLNTIDTPTISKVTGTNPVVNGDTFYKDFDDLMEGTTDEIGKIQVLDSDRDIIILKTRYTGSQTTNIKVRKYDLPLQNGGITPAIEVYENNYLKETFSDNLSLDYNEVDKRFDTIINQLPENGGSSYIQIQIVRGLNPISSDVEFPNGNYLIGQANSVFDTQLDSMGDPDDLNSYNFSVGTDGIPEDSTDLFEEWLQPDGELSNIEKYNFHLLTIPDNTTTEVQNAALKLANTRKDFFYLVDPPFGLNTEAVIDWHNGKGYERASQLNSQYGGVYHTWFKIYDSASKQYIWSPPSTLMAGKLISHDASVGCWMAPAGETNGKLTNVIDIEYSPKQTERDAMYTFYNRINPIIQYNSGLIVIMGEKTLYRENSALAKIHVVRTVIDIKKKLRSSLRSFLFLPNISSNWSKMSAIANSILQVYQQGGGILSYSVQIDSTTTPLELQQQDIAVMNIRIVPAGVLEQIEINLFLDGANQTLTT